MPPSTARCARRCGASTPTRRAYLHYFIDYHGKTDPEVAALKVEDLRESRLVVCDPAPIPLDEMQRTYDWLKSWDMLEETAIAAAARQHGSAAPRPSGGGVARRRLTRDARRTIKSEKRFHAQRARRRNRQADRAGPRSSARLYRPRPVRARDGAHLRPRLAVRRTCAARCRTRATTSPPSSAASR